MCSQLRFGMFLVKLIRNKLPGTSPGKGSRSNSSASLNTDHLSPRTTMGRTMCSPAMFCLDWISKKKKYSFTRLVSCQFYSVKPASYSVILFISLYCLRGGSLGGPPEQAAGHEGSNESANDERASSDGHGVDEREGEFVTIGSSPSQMAGADAVFVGTVSANGIERCVDLEGS